MPRNPAAPVTSTSWPFHVTVPPRDQSTPRLPSSRARAPGIGRAVAIGAARRRGYAVVARRPARSRRSRRRVRRSRAQDAGARRSCVPTDVSDPAVGARACSRRRATAFGRLDLLFNNAGISAPRRAARGADGRAMEVGRGREPDRRVPLHAAGVPADEGSAAAGRTHHQQRIDLGACAAAEFGALHRDQARDHRADEIDVARRPAITTSRAGRSTSATPPRT